MDEFQQHIIRSKKHKLIRNTVCNTSLLEKLMVSGTLSEDDVEELNALSNTPTAQAAKLYDFLLTRTNGFENLLEGLKQTKQSGAVALLTSYENNYINEWNDNSSVTFNDKEILGEGCYGTVVYKGKLGDRDVAVKRMNVVLESTKKLINKEIEILKICDNHENIVRYFFTKFETNYILIVLELCDMTLEHWVTDKSQRLRIKISALDAIKQITFGLEWLHDKNIVHRDLKPANILLIRSPSRVKITDFGLSRQIANGGTAVATGVVAGTEGWLAPEILVHVKEKSQPKFTFASDVFALGCIYYYVLTDGKHPFGDVLRRQANTADGKSVIIANDVSHCCVQNTMLIHLMISKNPKSRPPCPALLSYPIFWTSERCDKFLEDIGAMNIDEILNFIEDVKCKYDHTKARPTTKQDKISHKQRECAVPVVYFTCQLEPGLKQYYNEASMFDINEIQDILNKPKKLGTALDSKNARVHSNVYQRQQYFGDERTMFFGFAGFLVALAIIIGVYKNGLYSINFHSQKTSAVLDDWGLNTQMIANLNNQENEIVISKIESIRESIIQNDVDIATEKLVKILKFEDFEVIKVMIEIVGRFVIISQLWDNDAKSLLHVAAKHREYAVVEYLVEKHSFGDTLTAENMTDLIHTCVSYTTKQDFKVVEEKQNIIWLLSRKNPRLINSRDKNMNTPVLCQNVHVELLKTLIDLGADLHAVDANGYTMLHQAAVRMLTSDFQLLIKYLLNKGFKKEFGIPAGDDDTTPLHLAIREKLSCDDIKLLYLHKIDLNVQNKNGNTLFTHATQENVSQDLIDCMVELGANDGNQRNKLVKQLDEIIYMNGHEFQILGNWSKLIWGSVIYGIIVWCIKDWKLEVSTALSQLWHGCFALIYCVLSATAFYTVIDTIFNRGFQQFANNYCAPITSVESICSSIFAAVAGVVIFEIPYIWYDYKKTNDQRQLCVVLFFIYMQTKNLLYSWSWFSYGNCVISEQTLIILNCVLMLLLRILFLMDMHASKLLVDKVLAWSLVVALGEWIGVIVSSLLTLILHEPGVYTLSIWIKLGCYAAYMTVIVATVRFAW